MTDYGDHVKILTLPLIVALVIFLVGYVSHLAELWWGALVICIVLVTVIAILARFGGDHGRTG